MIMIKYGVQKRPQNPAIAGWPRGTLRLGVTPAISGTPYQRIRTINISQLGLDHYSFLPYQSL